MKGDDLADFVDGITGQANATPVRLRIICQRCGHVESRNVGAADFLAGAALEVSCPEHGPLELGDIAAPASRKALARRRGAPLTIRATPTLRA